MNIEKKLKEFVLDQLREAYTAETKEDALKIRGIAFGAVLFAINNLFPDYNEELANWWDEKVHPLFTERFD